MQSTRRTCSNLSSSRSVMRLSNTLTTPWVDLTSPALRGRALVEGSAKTSLCAIGGRTLPRRRIAVRCSAGTCAFGSGAAAVRRECQPSFATGSQRGDVWNLSALHNPIPSHPILEANASANAAEAVSSLTRRLGGACVSACVRAPRVGFLCVQHSQAHRRA